MNARGEIPPRGDFELRNEDFFLRFYVGIRHPSIQTDLPNSATMRVEMGLELFPPIRTALGGKPRVKPQRRDDFESAATTNALPVVFTRPITHHADFHCPRACEDLLTPGIETFVLQVIVGVIQHSDMGACKISNLAPELG